MKNIRSTKLEIIEMPIENIIAYKNNPRRHSREQTESIKESIDKLGNRKPIEIDENNVIICGHGRLEAYKALEYKTVPVIIHGDMTESEKKAYRIADNEIALKSEWDIDILNIELKDIDFEIGCVDELKAEFNKPEATEDDCQIPDDIKTDIKVGDLFQIGNHRLLCGDSTKKEDVDRLTEGGIPNLMVTDPPYGVDLDMTWRNKATKTKSSNDNVIMNDDNADWEEAYKLFKGNICYIWHATVFTDVIVKNLRNVGFETKQMLILNKSTMVMGRSDYHWKHEPCWYAVRKGCNHSWVGDRKQTTVIDAIMPAANNQRSEEERTEHPTQKPILCMSIPIRNHSGDVYDPFLGSGTTMVACQQLKRKCYGMELDPKYCQIIIERMKHLDSNIEIKKVE